MVRKLVKFLNLLQFIVGVCTVKLPDEVFIPSMRSWFVKTMTKDLTDRFSRGVSLGTPSLLKDPYILEPGEMKLNVTVDWDKPPVSVTGKFIFTNAGQIRGLKDSVDNLKLHSVRTRRRNEAYTFRWQVSIPKLSFHGDYETEIEVDTGARKKLRLTGNGPFSASVRNVYLDIRGRLEEGVRKTSVTDLKMSLGFQGLNIDGGKAFAGEIPINWKTVSADVQKYYDSKWIYNADFQKWSSKMIQQSTQDVLRVCALSELTKRRSFSECLEGDRTPSRIAPLPMFPMPEEDDIMDMTMTTIKPQKESTAYMKGGFPTTTTGIPTTVTTARTNMVSATRPQNDEGKKTVNGTSFHHRFGTTSSSEPPRPQSSTVPSVNTSSESSTQKDMQAEEARPRPTTTSTTTTTTTAVTRRGTEVTDRENIAETDTNFSTTRPDFGPMEMDRKITTVSYGNLKNNLPTTHTFEISETTVPKLQDFDASSRPPATSTSTTKVTEQTTTGKPKLQLTNKTESKAEKSASAVNYLPGGFKFILILIANNYIFLN